MSPQTILSARQEANKIIDKEFSLWRRIKRSKVSYMMIAPYFILFFLFTVIPVFSAMFLSFTDFNMLEMPRWRGWFNYVQMFLHDEIFLIAVKNTLVIAFITGPLSYFACFLFAWFINELPNKIRAVMTLVFYAPSISGNVFLIWAFLFSGDSYGFINGLLMKFGFIRQPIQWFSDPHYNLGLIIAIQIWLSLGASFLAFVAGLKSIDPTMYEAGSVDGIRNRWQELWYITVPSMKPQMLFGAVMQIAASFSVSSVPMALTGFPSTNYSTQTIVTHLLDYGTIRYEMGYASAIATVLFLTMIVTNNVITRLLRQ